MPATLAEHASSDVQSAGSNPAGRAFSMLAAPTYCGAWLALPSRPNRRIAERGASRARCLNLELTLCQTADFEGPWSVAIPMSDDRPIEPVDESIAGADHTSNDTEPAESPSTSPGEESRGVVDVATETVASVFRASFIVLGAVVLVLAVFIGVALFTNVDLAVLGNTIVASGIGFLATPFLTFAFLVVSALVLVPIVHESWAVAANHVMSILSTLAGGFGGAIVCGRVGGANPFLEFCGLVIFLIIFWEVVSRSRSRYREPTTIPILRKLTAREAIASVLGAIIGGLVHLLAPGWIDF